MRAASLLAHSATHGNDIFLRFVGGCRWLLQPRNLYRRSVFRRAQDLPIGTQRRHDVLGRLAIGIDGLINIIRREACIIVANEWFGGCHSLEPINIGRYGFNRIVGGFRRWLRKLVQEDGVHDGLDVLHRARFGIRRIRVGTHR